jgi:uncharacterized protein YgbK (DUF1537 family)
MKVTTVVLDDDPTGSQCAADAAVALEHDRATLQRLIASEPGLFVVTNTRALPAPVALATMRRLRHDLRAAAAATGRRLRIVLRGDSTLRGHIHDEIEVFGRASGRVLFVPAFPAAGRITVDGVHRVLVNGVWVDAVDTEFAADAAFGYRERSLVDFLTARLPGRLVVRVAAADVGTAVRSAPPGSVVVPDVQSNDEIAAIAAQVPADTADDVLVRCASPLAAELIGAASTGLLLAPLPRSAASRALVVCGSHTAASSEQLAELARVAGAPIVLSTAAAASGDPDVVAEAVGRVAAQARARLADHPVATVTTERTVHREHRGLVAGTRIMAALCSAVAALRDDVDVVIAKGGITSAEVARVGLSVSSARVLGQLQVGVSLWRVGIPDGAARDYVVVPGNIGGPSMLVDVLDAAGIDRRQTGAGRRSAVSFDQPREPDSP